MIDPKRILVFQTAYLGDVVLTTSLLSALKDRFPNARIDIVVQPQWKAVVAHNPHVDRVITFEKRGSESGPLETSLFARRLSQNSYDLALCPHPSFRSAMILRLAMIPVRIGFDDSSGSFFFTIQVTRDKNLHEVQRVLSLMQPLGAVPDQAPGPRVFLPPDLDVEALLKKLGIEKGARLAGLHPGSVWATKRWLPERFGEIGMRLAENFDRVVIFGGPGEKEQAAAVTDAAGPKALDLSEKLTLAELAAVISHLKLFVTNDSGPMHIAAAFGVPVVAIFGSTVPQFGYTPFATRSDIVEENMECRPCGPHGFRKCPLGHFRCMRDIGVQKVLAACETLLSVKV